MAFRTHLYIESVPNIVTPSDTETKHEKKEVVNIDTCAENQTNDDE